jgi:hypothetical protein
LFQKFHPHHVMTDPPEFFVLESPPSSCVDRSNGFFLLWKVHPYQVVTGPPEFLVALITWWQVHAQTLSNNISASVGPILNIRSLFFVELCICDDAYMLVPTKAVCEYINVEESNVIAKTLSNNILASSVRF